MDLRTRSRSITPYQSVSREKEMHKIGNHVQHRTSARSTRSTTSKIINVEDHQYFSEVPKQSGKIKNSKSERILRSSRHKTSDYSSEDGENENLNHTNDQNFQNQLIEEARKRRSASNSSSVSNISALDIYRAAGEYWNKYPKTDWTYSRHSKDRFEIAPGVVAMPNMSRKSIHNNFDNSNSEYLSDKQTNTSFSHDELDETDFDRITSRKYNSEYKPTRLIFNNSNNHSARVSYKSSAGQKNIFYRFLSFFTSIFVTIYSVILTSFSSVCETHNFVYIWFGKKIHKLVSKIMLVDTWLLRSSAHKKKTTSLLVLCLLPLFFIAGWWLLSGLQNSFYDLTNTSVIEKSKELHITDEKIIKRDVNSYYDTDFIQKSEEIIKAEHKEQVLIDPKEIPSQISEKQLSDIILIIKKELSFPSEDIVIEKILQSSRLHNLINERNIEIERNDEDDVLQKQREIIDDLKEEIAKMKSDILIFEKERNEKIDVLMSQLRAENVQNNVKVLHQLRRCCRNSFIQVENYVTKILEKLLGTPYPIRNKDDITTWLHSIFVAKQDLELKLEQITSNLRSDYNKVIEDNGHILMDNIATTITKELNVRIDKLQQEKDIHGSIQIDSLSDEYVKSIVRNALEIYDADKTGLVDYAMEPSGGQVLSTRCSESYHSRTAVVSILGIPLWYPSNTPRTVITPGVNPGECWAFQNFPGFLVVKLAGPIKIEAFSYEHISKRLMPNGKIDSAPKDFAVYGLKNETDSEPALIGTYRYDHDGSSLQFFAAQNQDMIFDIIELRVLSNHGNPNYTCLYRFRVHGILQNDLA